MASLKDTSVTGTLAVTGTITGTLSGTAQNANQLIGKNWSWSGQGGQPAWLWGGSDGTNMYVYNPSNFNVNYANSSNVCNTLSNHQWGSVGGNGYIRLSTGLILQWGDTGDNGALHGTNVYFPIAFPTAVASVVCTGRTDGNWIIPTIAKNYFRYGDANVAGAHGVRWMATGY